MMMIRKSSSIFRSSHLRRSPTSISVSPRFPYQLNEARRFMALSLSKPKSRISTNFHCSMNSIRHLSDSPKDSNDGKESSSNHNTTAAEKWIASFNDVVTAYPELSLYVFVCLRVGTWYALAAAYAFMPDIGPELAVGYLAAKFTGKLRQPFNLGLAAMISNEYPIFATVKASALIGLIKTKEEPADQMKVKPEIVVKLEKFLDWISGPIDKFGFSYFVASKVNVGLLIFGVSYGVKNGLDVPEMLSYMGISEGLQSGAGAMGAATLSCVVLTPVHLGVLPYVVPYAMSYRRKVDDVIQSMKDITDKSDRFK